MKLFECDLDDVLEYTEEDITCCENKVETEYISSLHDRYIPEPFQEDWDWYVKCYEYKHIPKRYYGKTVILKNKRLSGDAFNGEWDAVAFVEKTIGAAFMVHVGPRHPRI